MNYWAAGCAVFWCLLAVFWASIVLRDAVTSRHRYDSGTLIGCMFGAGIASGLGLWFWSLAGVSPL